MDWRNRVTVMSGNVFPGLSQAQLPAQNYDNDQVMSNLPLQMALYYNATFTPFWLVIMTLFLHENLKCFSELNKFILLTIITTVFIVEILRLYLGYEGNLKDKVPELAGFWMLSVLLQFPLQGILLFVPYFHLSVLETISQSLMFIMLTIQIISGYISLKFTATQQSSYFKIMKLKNDLSSVTNIQERYKIN